MNTDRKRVSGDPGNGGLVWPLICASFVLAPALAQAQIESAYPSKPLRIIVPVVPGGSTDILARLVAQGLGEAWRAQVIVENRPGASGIIGVEAAAKSAPDGYTLVMGYTGTISVNPSLFPKLPYDAVRDFAPITVVARVPNMLVVHPSLPVKSVKELVALARARPGQLNYGSAGSGSNSHLSVEYFKQLTKIEIAHIAYKGAGATVIDLIGGHISLTITGVPPLLPHVKTKRLRALGVSTATRLEILPDVPTMVEAGVPGYEVMQWYGLLAPARTPPEIVRKLNGEIVKFLQRADTAAKMSSEGAMPFGTTPEQFQELVKSEILHWAKVIKASGAKAE